MKHLVLIFTLMLLVVCGKTQTNLVLNPSFETLDSCVSSFSRIDVATGWENVCNNFICQSILVTPCNNMVPVYNGGGGNTYQFPKTGNNFCALHCFSPPPPNTTYRNFRDYSIGRLRETLIQNKQYCGKLYINLDNRSPYKINQFGMYFDDGTILGAQPTCSTVLSVIPQIENNPITILDDTLNWIKIEGFFTANGTENWVTFGNFKTDAATTGISTGFVTTFIPATYNIDDISLIPIEIKAFAGNDVTICVGDSVELGRPPEVGLECVWWPQGNNTNIISTKSRYTFKPTHEGVFNFVTQMDNCMLSYDTVNVTVVNDCNNTIDVPNTFTPNGDGINDVWQVVLKNCSNIKCSIFNRWGNLIRTTNDLEKPSFILWDGHTTSGEKVSSGVYYYALEYVDRKGDAISKKGFISIFN